MWLRFFLFFLFWVMASLLWTPCRWCKISAFVACSLPVEIRPACHQSAYRGPESSGGCLRNGTEAHRRAWLWRLEHFDSALSLDLNKSEGPGVFFWESLESLDSLDGLSLFQSKKEVLSLSLSRNESFCNLDSGHGFFLDFDTNRRIWGSEWMLSVYLSALTVNTVPLAHVFATHKVNVRTAMSSPCRGILNFLHASILHHMRLLHSFAPGESKDIYVKDVWGSRVGVRWTLCQNGIPKPQMPCLPSEVSSFDKGVISASVRMKANMASDWGWTPDGGHWSMLTHVVIVTNPRWLKFDVGTSWMLESYITLTLLHFQKISEVSCWVSDMHQFWCCQVETHADHVGCIWGIPASWKRWVIRWRRASRCISKSSRQNGCLGGQGETVAILVSELKVAEILAFWHVLSRRGLLIDTFSYLDQQHLGTFQMCYLRTSLTHWFCESLRQPEQKHNSVVRTWSFFFHGFSLRLESSHTEWLTKINIKARLNTHLEWPFLGKPKV